MTEQPNETRETATPRTDAIDREIAEWLGQDASLLALPEAYRRMGAFAAQLERELNEAKAEREWRPMSEAPNDGRSVLLLLLYGQSYHVRVAYWADEPEAWESEETGHIFTQDAIRGWQPLPPADAAMKPDQTV
jgi:hypothetical protein